MRWQSGVKGEVPPCGGQAFLPLAKTGFARPAQQGARGQRPKVLGYFVFKNGIFMKYKRKLENTAKFFREP